MALNAALNSEIICDLDGQPLERSSSSLLKAVDKLLTVGAYYSAEHDQYRVVSEKSCAQIVEAIGPGNVAVIEITASGMMVGAQLIDPHHRNVRLLHDLLVPLNIARFEIRSDLTAADLRQTISALQEHKQNLGNTEGFQEIKIENLPDSVSTASRSVTSKEQNQGDGLSLDELLGSGPADSCSTEEPATASEQLAREFMKIVNNILENLEKEDQVDSEPGNESNSDSSPENIRALREALQRLVEVNPDPSDLARLIEHAKRALDLSHDPNSVDLVFSLLKKEAANGGEWKYKAREKLKPKPEYKLSLEQLKEAASELESRGDPPEEPGPSAMENYLGISFHLLGSDPAETLEIALMSNLNRVLAGGNLTDQDLSICSAAVATSAQNDDKNTLDRLLPAFCGPMRESRPDYLGQFWVRLWEFLEPARRTLVWPHLVSDLLLASKDFDPDAANQLWLAAGALDSRAAFLQVSRLECTPALLEKPSCTELMKLPLTAMYPVHLVLMKSSLAPVHGPRIHDHLKSHPPNTLTDILMTAVSKYSPANDGFYLSFIKQVGGDTITLDLRKQTAQRIARALVALPGSNRKNDWVLKALGWLAKLDVETAAPYLRGILSQRKFFFFPAWPSECRELAGKILADAKDGR